MQTETRQQRRAQERSIVKKLLTKSDRRKLSRMKNPKRRAVRAELLAQGLHKHG